MRYILILIFTVVGLVGIMFYEPKVDEKLLSVFDNKVTIDYNDLDTNDEWTYEINNNNLKYSPSIPFKGSVLECFKF